jgi:hypothetical protein
VSLERAEQLALEGRFGASEAALRRVGGRTAYGRWISAYLAASRGDFARAERLARALLSSPRASEDVRVRAAITLGSVLRQTARHADARRVERQVLARAGSSSQRAHLHVGLAADAVGLGELSSVDAELARAGELRVRDWRVRVRLAWVRCERELLAGRPRAAVRHARSALSTAERAGARKHVAKSLLFLGVSLREAGAATEAGGSLRRARTIASSIGAHAIARVAGDTLRRQGARR